MECSKNQETKDTSTASARSMQRVNNSLIATTIELFLTKEDGRGGNWLLQHAACHWCFLMARDLPRLAHSKKQTFLVPTEFFPCMVCHGAGAPSWLGRNMVRSAISSEDPATQPSGSKNSNCHWAQLTLMFYRGRARGASVHFYAQMT